MSALWIPTHGDVCLCVGVFVCLYVDFLADFPIRKVSMKTWIISSIITNRAKREVGERSGRGEKGGGGEEWGRRGTPTARRRQCRMSKKGQEENTNTQNTQIDLTKWKLKWTLSYAYWFVMLIDFKHTSLVRISNLISHLNFDLYQGILTTPRQIIAGNLYIFSVDLGAF